MDYDRLTDLIIKAGERLQAAFPALDIFTAVMLAEYYYLRRIRKCGL